MSLSVLYIGGTGQISLPCVQKSVAAGHNIFVFNRGRTDQPLPSGVTSITGDMKDPASYRQLAERHFDVVCQFMAFLPEQMASDIEIFKGIFPMNARPLQPLRRRMLLTD